jgi:hypothetical protein
MRTRLPVVALRLPPANVSNPFGMNARATEIVQNQNVKMVPRIPSLALHAFHRFGLQLSPQIVQVSPNQRMKRRPANRSAYSRTGRVIRSTFKVTDFPSRQTSTLTVLPIGDRLTMLIKWLSSRISFPLNRRMTSLNLN